METVRCDLSLNFVSFTRDLTHHVTCLHTRQNQLFSESLSSVLAKVTFLECLRSFMYEEQMPLYEKMYFPLTNEENLSFRKCFLLIFCNFTVIIVKLIWLCISFQSKLKHWPMLFFVALICRINLFLEFAYIFIFNVNLLLCYSATMLMSYCDMSPVHCGLAMSCLRLAHTFAFLKTQLIYKLRPPLIFLRWCVLAISVVDTMGIHDKNYTWKVSFLLYRVLSKICYGKILIFSILWNS